MTSYRVIKNFNLSVALRWLCDFPEVSRKSVFKTAVLRGLLREEPPSHFIPFSTNGRHITRLILRRRRALPTSDNELCAVILGIGELASHTLVDLENSMLRAVGKLQKSRVERLLNMAIDDVDESQRLDEEIEGLGVAVLNAKLNPETLDLARDILSERLALHNHGRDALLFAIRICLKGAPAATLRWAVRSGNALAAGIVIQELYELLQWKPRPNLSEVMLSSSNWLVRMLELVRILERTESASPVGVLLGLVQRGVITRADVVWLATSQVHAPVRSLLDTSSVNNWNEWLPEVAEVWLSVKLTDEERGWVAACVRSNAEARHVLARLVSSQPDNASRLYRLGVDAFLDAIKNDSIDTGTDDGEKRFSPLLDEAVKSHIARCLVEKKDFAREASHIAKPMLDKVTRLLKRPFGRVRSSVEYRQITVAAACIYIFALRIASDGESIGKITALREHALKAAKELLRHHDSAWRPAWLFRLLALTACMNLGMVKSDSLRLEWVDCRDLPVYPRALLLWGSRQLVSRDVPAARRVLARAFGLPISRDRLLAGVMQARDVLATAFAMVNEVPLDNELASLVREVWEAAWDEWQRELPLGIAQSAQRLYLALKANQQLIAQLAQLG